MTCNKFLLDPAVVFAHSCERLLEAPVMVASGMRRLPNAELRTLLRKCSASI